MTQMPPPVIPGRNNAAFPPPYPTSWGRTGEIPPPPPGFVWETGEHGPVQKKDKGPALAVIIVAAVFLFCGAFGIAAILANQADSDPAVDLTVSPTVAVAPVMEPSKAAPVTKAPASDGSVRFKAGETFRAGDFQITLHGSKCGMTKVGSQYLNTQAQGQFCRIDLTAKNVTRSPHYYDTASSITAFDASGRKFNPDGEAGIYGNPDNGGFLEQVNPGNQTRAFVFIDFPKGVSLAKLEFSPGVFTTADPVTVTF